MWGGFEDLTWRAETRANYTREILAAEGRVFAIVQELEGMLVP